MLFLCSVTTLTFEEKSLRIDVKKLIFVLYSTCSNMGFWFTDGLNIKANLFIWLKPPGDICFVWYQVVCAFKSRATFQLFSARQSFSRNI